MKHYAQMLPEDYHWAASAPTAESAALALQTGHNRGQLEATKAKDDSAKVAVSSGKSPLVVSSKNDRVGDTRLELVTPNLSS
jgi:2-C-methyl-D-erythritol 4-phosphate cytidylyltransferase